MERSPKISAANSGKKMSSHMKITKMLGTDIVTGVLEPGAQLPGETELAEDLGVSRSVVREALRVLGSKGLIISKPKSGTRVQSRSFWNTLDPTLLSWMFDKAPPAKFVRSLFELRMIVEPSAAEIAAQKRTADQLVRMGSALEEMARHTLATEKGQEADQRFHAIILEATENELLISLSATIEAAVRWTTFFKYRSSKSPKDPIQQHRDLFMAIAEGNAAAARDVTTALVRQAEIDTKVALDDIDGHD